MTEATQKRGSSSDSQQANLTQMAGFVEESTSFRWLPSQICRFAASEFCRAQKDLEELVRVIFDESFQGNNTGKVRTPGHAIECQAFPISKADMLGQLWLKMFRM